MKNFKSHPHIPVFLMGVMVIVSGLIYFTPTDGHDYDMACWARWAVYQYKFGLPFVYEANNDYLPMLHYVTWIYNLFKSSAEKAAADIYQLKYASIIFHGVFAVFLGIFLNQQYPDKPWIILAGWLYLFHPAALYNSMIWAQYDEIYSGFILMSLIFAWHKKSVASILCYVVAFHWKLQSIVFFPLLGLILLEAEGGFPHFKTWLKWISTAAIGTLVLWLPFLWYSTYPLLLSEINASFNRYPLVSLHAFNAWVLLTTGDYTQISDTQRWLGVTYKAWGQITFCALSFFAMWPLCKILWKQWMLKLPVRIRVDEVCLMMMILALLFFYVNTQMHERYNHPMLIAAFLYGWTSGRWWFFTIGTFAYLLNQESVFRYFEWFNYDRWWFQPEPVAMALGLLLLGMFVDLYRRSLPIFKKS